MTKQTKRTDVLQQVAVKLGTLYRETGGKGPAWRRVMRKLEACPPMPTRDWVHLFVCALNVGAVAGKRRRS